LNFPTKDHWRSVTQLDSVIRGLDYLLEHYQEWGIQSLAIPPLGAGLGQLEWRVIGPTLYRYLNRMDIEIELYAPYNTPSNELRVEFLEENAANVAMMMPEPSWIKPGWIALVEILKRIDEQTYHWPIGRTIFQKIAYVATAEGLPTALDYEKSSYGPFSGGLKAVVTRLINNGLIEERRNGQMFEIRVGATYMDAKQAYAEDLAEWDSLIDKVADLFLRLDTSQAEIVATVLFSARLLEKNSLKTPSEHEILNAVMEWKEHRKPPLSVEMVSQSIRNLAILGWINVTASEDLPLSDEYMLDF
jgi:uncharacterized protein YwgA